MTINTTKCLFVYNRLLFGVASAPAIFQRCIESILRNCPGISVYMDDILVTGASTEEHLENLDRVLGRLREVGLRLNRNKCQFMQTRVEYLGHVIDADGLHPTESKIKAIKEEPSPSNVTQLRSFLGIINYYRHFLPNLSGSSIVSVVAEKSSLDMDS